MNPANTDRYAWVDFAKGICIVAVVTLYTTNYVNDALHLPNWMNHWIEFAKPFRMPDFFLLSGLFLSRVIDRPWREYLDKKVVHYVYFLVLWTIIILPFTWPGRGISPDLDDAIKDLVYYLYEPWAMLWFIQMLAVFFVVTRLTRRLPWWLVFGLAALLQMFPFNTGVPTLNWFAERFVYFYGGYRFAPRVFALAAWAEINVRTALVGLLIWALINGALVLGGWAERPGISLMLGFAGAGAVMAAAALLVRFRSMDWLRYLGEHSIVVYLGFYLPLMGFIAAFVASGMTADPGLLAVLIAALSIASAVALFWATRRTWLAFLFTRPKWAHLPGTRTRAKSAGTTQ